jgi:hypothetical protein
MNNEELTKLVKAQAEQIAALTRRLDALGNNATIPYDTGEAIKARVLNDAGLVSLSTKAGSSEGRSVSEAGIASYTVQDLADGYLEVTLAGVTRYIPFYS